MDIKDIKTIEQAKSLCYDEVKRLNQAQQNINLLEARILELEKIEARETTQE
jgi:hypothetical protein